MTKGPIKGNHEFDEIVTHPFLGSLGSGPESFYRQTCRKITYTCLQGYCQQGPVLRTSDNFICFIFTALLLLHSISNFQLVVSSCFP